MKSEKSVRVLHILKNMQKGGVERFILNQYYILSKQSVQFDIVLYGPDKKNNDPDFIKEFESMGGNIIYLPFPNSRFLLFAKELSHILKKYNYDVIHSHQNLFSGAILIIAKINNIPIRVAHAHTSKERKRNNLIRKLYSKVMRNLISFSATHFLCASPSAGRYVFKAKVNAEFLPNGIRIKPFLEKSKKNIRRELNIPKNDIVIGHVGSFKLVKNHDFIIDLFNIFQKKHSNSHLILVGGGKQLDVVKSKVDGLKLRDRVHFLGNRNDVPELMKIFDVFLFPSHFEGLGIVLIEAQASGVNSIVSSNIPKEVDLGINLITFLSLSQPEQWISTMEKIIANTTDLPSLDIRGKKIYEKKFDNESSANRLLEIYTSHNR